MTSHIARRHEAENLIIRKRVSSKCSVINGDQGRVLRGGFLSIASKCSVISA